MGGAFPASLRGDDEANEPTSHSQLDWFIHELGNALVLHGMCFKLCSSDGKSGARTPCGERARDSLESKDLKGMALSVGFFW